MESSSKKNYDKTTRLDYLVGDFVMHTSEQQLLYHYDSLHHILFSSHRR